MRFFLSSETDVFAGPDGPLLRVEARLNRALQRRHYGPGVKKIGIIPIIMCDRFGRRTPERRLYQRRVREADYRTRIDHIAWQNGDAKVRELLLLSNVIQAVSDLGRKIGRGFEADKLIDDICELYKMSADGYGSAERLPKRSRKRTREG